MTQPTEQKPDTKIPTYVYTRTERTGLIAKRDHGELLFMGIIVGGAIILAMFPFPLLLRALLLMGSVAIAIGGVYLPYRPRGTKLPKRTFYKWYRPNRSYKKLLKNSGGQWRNSSRESGFDLEGRPIKAPEPPGIGQIIWSLAEMPSYEGMLGVMLFPQMVPPRLACAVEVEGPGISGKDPGDQARSISLWQKVLDQVGNGGDGAAFARYLQLLERCLPDDPQAHQRYFQRRVSPRAPARLRKGYEEQIERMPTAADQHRCFLVLRADVTPELTAAAGHPTSVGKLARLIADEMRQVLTRLRDTDIRFKRLLNPTALAGLFRNAYLPHAPLDHPYYNVKTAFPHTLDLRNDQYVLARDSDSSKPAWMTSVASVSAWPRRPVPPNFLMPLLMETPYIVRNVSLVMRLEPSYRALARVLSAQTHLEADRLRDAHRGKRADPRDTLAASHMAQMEHSLTSGAAGAGAVAYVSVTLPEGADLRSARALVTSRAWSAGMDLEWCDREQPSAMLAMLPVAAGIK